MVVTSHAADRHSQERFSDRVELLVDRVHEEFFFVRLGQHFRTEHQEARRRFRFTVRAGHEVARQLLDQKSAERLVIVERVDNVVAISPSVTESQVLIKSVRIGIPGDVQPVPSPANTVLRRFQQALDHFLEGVSRVVCQIRSKFFRSRRQTDQIKRDPTQQRSFVRSLRRTSLAFFKLCQHKGIDGCLNPGCVFDGWNHRIGDRFERPELTTFVDRHPRRPNRTRLSFGTRIRNTQPHPFLEDRNFGIRQSPLRRHL